MLDQFRTKFLSLLTLVFLLSAFGLVRAEVIKPSKLVQLECGQILDSETNPNERFQDYKINASAGTVLNGRVEPIGKTFNVGIWFADSGGSVYAAMNSNAAGLAEEFADFTIGSSNSLLRVGGYRPSSTELAENPFWSFDTFNYYGAYTIYLGCTLRDGTVINPGDAAPDPNQNGGNNPPDTPTFSGTGFPGLAPVDFSAVAKIPMIANVPMTGGVAPDGSTILGYTVDANANDTLALGFSRLSGNLNLGLVVLSSDNKVVFQASLVTSSELTTKFTLPTAGTYTIGIFRIDLLPPAAPEATAFQLTATLNS